MKKLGLRDGFSVYLYNVPDEYFCWLAPLSNIDVKAARKGSRDFVHVFVKDEKEMVDQLKKGKAMLKADGMIWVSWSKKTSPYFAGLTEDMIRQAGLKAGLVDVKVCAVNEVWSGLKFVIPLKDR